MNEDVRNYTKANIISEIFSRVIYGRNSTGRTRPIMVGALLGCASLFEKGSKKIRDSLSERKPEPQKENISLESLKALSNDCLKYNDKVSEIVEGYEFCGSKYLRIAIANDNWKYNVMAITFLVNEETGLLRIFFYDKEDSSAEYLYQDLVRICGLPSGIYMDASNLGLIYKALRHNYL